MFLPILWISQSFGCPNNFDILSCNFQLPQARNIKGNPFYASALQTFSKVTDHKISTVENLYNTKIWFNNELKTKLIHNLQKKGFEFLKDLFPGNKLIGHEEINERGDLADFEKQQIISIKNKIPNQWELLTINQNISFVPQRRINVKETEFNVFSCKNKQIYEALIKSSQQIPIGFEHWCLDLQLGLEEVAKCFLNARKATTNSFARCFQYKILTKILPTKEYLLRYQAPDVDNNICTRCQLERDTIEHSLFECDRIQSFLTRLTQWIQQELLIRDFELTMKNFLFGNIGRSKINKGLEHILLEAKKYIFYELGDQANINAEFHMTAFVNRIKHLVMLERKIAENLNKMEKFEEKWECCETVFNIFDPGVEI